MTVIPQTAMLFAAGLGKRMLPLTKTCPKPMVEVAGRSLIARSLDMLEAAGVQRVVVNTHHLADKVKGYLNTRSTPEILISHEETLMETGGGIVQALSLLDDAPFFCANSDVIVLDGAYPALWRLADMWERSNGTLDSLLLVHSVAKAVGYDGKGDFFIDGDGFIRPRNEHEVAPFVFTGIQILHPRVFSNCPEGAFSLSALFPRLLGGADGTSAPRIRAIVHDGKWLHVGDVKGIGLAEKHL